MKMSLISPLICLNLVPPESLTATWPFKQMTHMPMPETAIYLYHGFPTW